MNNKLIPILTVVLVWSWSYLSLAQSLKKGDYHFDFVRKIECGPVEDQGSTGTCWSFSTTSYLETEAARTGKKMVDLSEMFYVRLNYLEKAELYLRFQGSNGFTEGSLSHDVLRLYGKFGAMPESAYSGLTAPPFRHNHSRLVVELKKYLDGMIDDKKIPSNWRDEFNGILDLHLGPMPAKFVYDGREMGAMEFAANYVGVNSLDYWNLTSFSHHDLYTSFILEIPDNYSRERYLNVSMADLTNIADSALEHGHSVIWDCDVSEYGFSARQGLAIIPAAGVELSSKQSVFDRPCNEIMVTAEMRQEEFDNYSLTDDHLMHIVGLAKDQNGKNYYYVKNSWGDAVGMEGYLFASQPYYRLNTISITLHRDAIPSSIMARLNKIDSLQKKH